MRAFGVCITVLQSKPRVRFWVTGGDAHFQNPALSHPSKDFAKLVLHLRTTSVSAGSFGELGADPHQPWGARGGRPSIPR